MKIKALLEEKNITQREFANKLGYPQSTASQYINEIRQPNLNELIRISDFFKCSIDYLLEHESEDGIVQVQDTLSDNERKLLDGYNQLNRIAKAKMMAYMEGLLENPLAKEKLNDII